MKTCFQIASAAYLMQRYDNSYTKQNKFYFFSLTKIKNAYDNIILVATESGK